MPLFIDSLFSVSTYYHSYYGLSVWFPDMIKHLQYEEYQSKVKVKWTRIYETHKPVSVANWIL